MEEKNNKKRCNVWPNDNDTAVPVPTDDDGLTSIDIISNRLYFMGAIPLMWILLCNIIIDMWDRVHASVTMTDVRE